MPWRWGKEQGRTIGRPADVPSSVAARYGSCKILEESFEAAAIDAFARAALDSVARHADMANGERSDWQGEEVGRDRQVEPEDVGAGEGADSKR